MSYSIEAFDDYELRSVHEEAARNADQAEFKAMELGTVTIEDGILDEKISGVIDDPDYGETGEREDWARRDDRLEKLSGATSDEVRRRIDLLGHAYPFSFDHNALTYTGSRTLVYEFCLAVTIFPVTGYPVTFSCNFRYLNGIDLLLLSGFNLLSMR